MIHLKSFNLFTESISAWHGSPHTIDKFSSEHIGKGEGSQSYGWGLYFTDKKEISEYYATTLGTHYNIIDGTTPNWVTNFNIEDFNSWMNTEISPKNPKWTREIILQGIKQFGNPDELIKKIEETKKGERIYLGINLSRIILDKKELINYIKKYVKSGGKKNVYKVTIHPNKSPEEYDYLRWDLPPTKEQLEKISSNDPVRLINSDRKLYSGDWNNYSKYTGQNLYLGLKARFGSDKEASLFLLKCGIDGIKYPTEFLSKGTHEKNFNYVVFDENSVEIDEINNL